MLELLTRGGITKPKLSFWSLVTDLLQHSMYLGRKMVRLFTIRFSVEDLSMLELKGEYDVVDTPKSS